MKGNQGTYVPDLLRKYQEVLLLSTLFRDGFGGFLGVVGLKLQSTVASLALIAIIVKIVGNTNHLVPFILVIGVSSWFGFLAFLMPLGAAVGYQSTEFCWRNFKDPSQAQQARKLN